MRKYLIFVLVLIISLSSVLAASPDYIVYKTKTGTKYHLGGCSSLSRSKFETTLGEAVKIGLTPCSVCNPPILDKEHQTLYKVTEISSYKNADISKMLKAEVIRTVDGDTIKVLISTPSDELEAEETIRLIGVDTPETVHPSKPVEYFGKEASNYTKQLTGKTVFLAFDWDRRDYYGRLLAYIYLESGECFNAMIIEEGYAYAYLTYPFQFIDEFKDLERTAREHKTGLWNQPN